MSGEIPTTTPETNKEIKEAESGENWIQETGEEGGSEDEEAEFVNSDLPFHTNTDNYRLLKVVLEVVTDLKSQVCRLDSSNNNLAKQFSQQSPVILEHRSTVQ